MTPADERVLKLLAKWRASLELHAGYTRLSDDEYWLVQPWPKHQRPTAWVIELARQRLADLERIVKTRLASGDASISEALELMAFLSNLVGAQNVERFVPIAEPEQERPMAGLKRGCAGAAEAAPQAPAPRSAASRTARTRAGRREPTAELPALPGTEATREMPALDGPDPLDATAEMPGRLRTDATREMPALGAAPGAAARGPATEGAAAAAERSSLPEDERELEVVRDAVRLLGWGREWHELPEAIARMAGRPDKRRVRGILQSHRAAIERAAGTGSRTH